MDCKLTKWMACLTRKIAVKLTHVLSLVYLGIGKSSLGKSRHKSESNRPEIHQTNVRICSLCFSFWDVNCKLTGSWTTCCVGLSSNGESLNYNPIDWYWWKTNGFGSGHFAKPFFLTTGHIPRSRLRHISRVTPRSRGWAETVSSQGWRVEPREESKIE